MKYSLLSLLILVTAFSLVFGLARHGPTVFLICGLWVVMLIWNLVQFGRELNRPRDRKGSGVFGGKPCSMMERTCPPKTPDPLSPRLGSESPLRFDRCATASARC
jgi:hypothetical protein